MSIVERNPQHFNIDWKKKLEEIQERLQHCQKTAAKLKAILEPVARELSMYNILLKQHAVDSEAKINCV